MTCGSKFKEEASYHERYIRQLILKILVGRIDKDEIEIEEGKDEKIQMTSKRIGE